MQDFQFSFTWQDTDYTAQSQIKGDMPKQKFIVTVDDASLQAQFGTQLEFVRSSQDTFSWDTPNVDQASDYMRAVNMGMLEYLDEIE